MKKFIVFLFLLFTLLIFMFGYDRKSYLDASNYTINDEVSLTLFDSYKSATNVYFEEMSLTFKNFTSSFSEYAKNINFSSNHVVDNTSKPIDITSGSQGGLFVSSDVIEDVIDSIKGVVRGTTRVVAFPIVVLWNFLVFIVKCIISSFAYVFYLIKYSIAYGGLL